jgi:hypothetical protein
VSNLEIALQKARRGNPIIDTPWAASDLFSLLRDIYDPNRIHGMKDIVEILKVEDPGYIQFRVKSVLFNFYFNTTEFTLYHKPMEGTDWIKITFKETKNDVDCLIQLVQNHVTNPPSPV